MTIIDACPTRGQKKIHQAIRCLLRKMNIQLVEPENRGTKSTCCGDSYWGHLPENQVKERMAARTAEMPVDDVVVYCVSCSKSVFIGQKNPIIWLTCCLGKKLCPKPMNLPNGTKS